MYKKLLIRLEKKFKFDSNYFINNGFWVISNQTILMVSSLLTTVIFAHYLSEELYGNYRYLVVLASLFAIISLNSIGQSILQSAAKGYLAYYQTAMRLSLWSNLGTTLSALTIGGYYLYYGNQLLGFGCLTIAILQPFTSNYFNVFSLLFGQQKFGLIAIYQTIRSITLAIGTIISVLITQNVLILFVTYLTLQLLTNAVGHFYFKPTRAELHTPTPPEITRSYNQFALHLSIQNGILNLAQRLDSLIVFQFLGATPLATYAIAQIVPDQLKSMVKNFSTLLFPKYVHYTHEQLIQSIPKRSLQLFIVLISITMVYMLLAPFIITWLLPKYTTAIVYTQLLALAVPASVLYIVQSAIKSQTKSTQLYYIQFSHATIKIILVFIGIYYFGIWGAIGAYIASSYVELMLYYGVYFTSKRTHLDY